MNLLKKIVRRMFHPSTYACSLCQRASVVRANQFAKYWSEGLRREGELGFTIMRHWKRERIYTDRCAELHEEVLRLQEQLGTEEAYDS